MVIFGALVRQELIGTTKFGQISKIALSLAELPKTIDQIFAHPMTKGPDFLDKNPGFSGRAPSLPSYLLLSRYSAELEQSLIELIDLNGFDIIHTWKPDIVEASKRIKSNYSTQELYGLKWNQYNSLPLHPIIDENLNIYFSMAGWDGAGSPLYSFDKKSMYRAISTKNLFHHSIEQDEQNNYWCPTIEYPISSDREVYGERIKDFVNDAITLRVDIFSLGVVAYQMLSGQFPYGIKVSKARSRLEQKKLSYIPISEHGVDLPYWVEETLRKAVSVNPLKRYHEVSEFMFDLRTPNKSFKPQNRQPLIESNPLAFWKGLSLILFLVIILQAVLAQ